LTYTKAQSGVILNATRSSGDSLTAGTSAAFTVNPGAVSATTSSVNMSPSSVPADGATTSTITVTLLDANSNPVSGKTVTLAQGSGSSTISAASGASSATGVVTFTVKDTVAQTVVYTATDTTDGTTITDTATVTFTPGTATKLVFTTQPGGGLAGAAWTTQPAVTVEDVNGNTVTGSSATIALAIGTNPGGGTLTCTGGQSKSASSGIATFAGCKISVAGSGYTLSATSSGLTSATSGAFNVQDFTLVESLSSASMNESSTLTETNLLSLTNLGGFSGSVALTCSDGDSNRTFTCGSTGSGTISFSPASISGSGTSTMTAQTATNTEMNAHTITITGTSGSLTHTVTFTITVN
jgi:hypothetical protein